MVQKSIHWTESAVYAQLRHIWPSPAYVKIPQVRNGTGFSRHRTRTADAIVLSAWPSRGLWMAGIEIKVSVADWKKELAHPEKANEIQQYCHHWYVAAPRGLIDQALVPDLWGLVEVTGNTAEIVKSAPHLDPKPIDLPLLCSILRSVESVTVPRDLVQSEIAAAVDKALTADQSRRQYEHESLTKSVKAFEEAAGISIACSWDAGHVGAAVAFVRKARVTAIESGIERLARQCEQAGSEFRQALNDYKAGIVHEDEACSG
jgi:hypothetical protein